MQSIISSWQKNYHTLHIIMYCRCKYKWQKILVVHKTEINPISSMGHTDVETCGRAIRWTLVVINIIVLVIQLVLNYCKQATTFHNTFNKISLTPFQLNLFNFTDWRNCRFSAWGLDIDRQIIHRSVTKKQLIYVSRLYYDCFRQYIFMFIHHRICWSYKGKATYYTNYSF